MRTLARRAAKARFPPPGLVHPKLRSAWDSDENHIYDIIRSAATEDALQYETLADGTFMQVLNAEDLMAALYIDGPPEDPALLEDAPEMEPDLIL